MRAILVHADRSPAMMPRLETALALARLVSGHVSVLIDTPVRGYISVGPVGGGHVATEEMAQALASDDVFAEAIEVQLSAQDVPFEVVRREDDPVEALAEAARLADLVVLCRTPRLAGELALATDTPILVLPDDGILSLPPRSACVAWDGGKEASHALRAAVPLLALSHDVHILTVEEKPGGFAAADAAAYLAHHGIAAQVRELERSGSTEETLAAGVARFESDLLVMGAFGHNRMREYLFGGVTRHFLEECQRPALLLKH